MGPRNLYSSLLSILSIRSIVVGSSQLFCADFCLPNSMNHLPNVHIFSQSDINFSNILFAVFPWRVREHSISGIFFFFFVSFSNKSPRQVQKVHNGTDFLCTYDVCSFFSLRVMPDCSDFIDSTNTSMYPLPNQTWVPLPTCSKANLLTPDCGCG